jgi:hypothetical protein
VYSYVRRFNDIWYKVTIVMTFRGSIGILFGVKKQIFSSFLWKIFPALSKRTWVLMKK